MSMHFCPACGTRGHLPLIGYDRGCPVYECPVCGYVHATFFDKLDGQNLQEEADAFMYGGTV